MNPAILQRVTRRLAGAALAIAATACARTYNHVEAAGPRYMRAAATHDSVASAQLRVVSFNVKYAEQVDSAIALLKAEPWLSNADVLFLQEMDEAGTRRIANAYGGSYVYYPATRHPGTGRDFGNAIVTRWPIEDDRKIILPHTARWVGTQRAAVGATLRIGDQRVRVYSLHLATLIANGPGSRREQLAAVLADADSFPVVIMGGDFNSETVPRLALEHGYAWPTRALPRTNGLWTFDHFLVKGLPAAGTASSGTVVSARGASDHLPVWAVLPLGN